MAAGKSQSDQQVTEIIFYDALKFDAIGFSIALLALMTSRHTGLGGMAGPNLAVLLCFLAGIVELLMALLKLGALVDLISLPVTIGFTSATALIIGASQLKGLLGLQGSGGSSNFLPTIKFVITKFNELSPSDTLLGIGSIITLLLLRVNMIKK